MAFQRDDVLEFDDLATGESMEPTHPGRILCEAFLEPLGISASRLAKAIGVPKNRITGIVNGERAITSDTALRLARFFGVSAEFWANLQSRYDLDVARRDHGRSEEHTSELQSLMRISYAVFFSKNQHDYHTYTPLPTYNEHNTTIH